MFLLDSDTFTHAFHNRHGIRERIARETETVALSPITRIESLRGRFDAVIKAAAVLELQRALARLADTETFLATFRVVEFCDDAMLRFGRFRDERRFGKMGWGDLLTACIALAHGATPLTRNTKDFAAVPGLKLENWAD